MPVPGQQSEPKNHESFYPLLAFQFTVLSLQMKLELQYLVYRPVSTWKSLASRPLLYD